MSKIKLCGLSRPCDIEAANRLMPEYIGFVFAEKSRRAVSPETAKALRALLQPGIQAVGVFVNAPAATVADYLNEGIINIAQLHGSETPDYIRSLRTLTRAPLIQAFKVTGPETVKAAEESPADLVLLDSGAGTGMTFNWELIRPVRRPFFLAGGLTPENVGEAVHLLNPHAVDVSSGIETDGLKDEVKMAAFVASARKGN